MTHSRVYFLGIGLLLTGCMQSTPLEPHERPKDWGMVIAQKHNFYQISPILYRSEQPSEALIDLINQHQIDVVINLRSQDHDSQILNQQHFKLVHIPIRTWAIDREDLLKVMTEIQVAQSKQQSVLIHCYHGSDRTGASIAMYRIIFEGWSREDALQEMKHGGYGFHKIWVNIENLFTPENIKWIRDQLSNPST